MRKEFVIVIAEDNHGHFILTKHYLQRMGVRNEIVWLADGEETMDFFLNENAQYKRDTNRKYVLLLDIRMPGVDGTEVLARMKDDIEARDVPVIMLTSTDNPHEIENCYDLQCSAYIIKPVTYAKYIDAMRKVGLFPSVINDGVLLMSKHPT